MIITGTGVAEQTRNPKYQKIDQRGGQIYHVGLAGVPEAAGKRVTVTIEIHED